LGELPVVHLWELDADAIIVIDASRRGKLEHFCSDGELFRFVLRDFATDEAIAGILRQVPGLRRGPKGRFRSLHEINRELRQRVHLTVSLDIRFRVSEPEAGLKIPVSIPNK